MLLRELADGFARMEETGSRLEMVRVLAELLEAAAEEERAPIAYLVQGRLRPAFEPVQFGMGAALLRRALAAAYGVSEATVSRRYREAGDLGTVAEALAGSKSAERLGVDEAYDALLAIARVAGKGAQQRKVDGLAALLRRIGAREARYVTRVVQGRLRLGVGDQTLLEAIAAAALGGRGKKPAVEHAYNIRPDVGWVAETAFQGGERALRAAAPAIGVPIRPELAQRLNSAEAILERLGTVQAEPKYDGFRLQLHRRGDEIHAFSRRLEDVTGMFPDVAEAIRRQLGIDEAILEGEAVVHNPETGEFLPFQVTMVRKRKHHVAEMAERYPLRFFAFDLLYAEGEALLAKPLAERRRRLVRALPYGPDDAAAVAEAIVTRKVDELQAFFDAMVERGLEGILAKRPDAPYHAGARNYDWIKLKRGFQATLADTIDVVLVGYLKGRGKRAALGIGSLLGAVYDPDRDRFRTVAKIGSGPSQAEWRELRRRLDEDAVDEKPRRVDSLIVPDVWVEPRLVVTVLADEITRSPMHTCGKEGKEPGYALRFPRLTDMIRPDKAAEDATTEEEILEMYRLQGAPERAGRRTGGGAARRKARPGGRKARRKAASKAESKVQSEVQSKAGRSAARKRAA